MCVWSSGQLFEHLLHLGFSLLRAARATLKLARFWPTCVQTQATERPSERPSERLQCTHRSVRLVFTTLSSRKSARPRTVSIETETEQLHLFWRRMALCPEDSVSSPKKKIRIFLSQWARQGRVAGRGMWLSRCECVLAQLERMA